LLTGLIPLKSEVPLKQQRREGIFMKIRGAVLREINKPYSVEELE